MTEQPVRRRAPGMSPEQRREMIIHAALPLVAEFGTAVTTAQVARAAGIGEATVFRAFADKEALLDACVAEALDVTHLLRELRSISLDQPLAERLADAADALRGHLDRMGAVIGALLASGRSRRPPIHSGQAPVASARDEAEVATLAAVAELFEPDAAVLRLPPLTLAEVFCVVIGERRRTPPPAATAATRATTAQLISLFLHGAYRRDGEPT